MRLDRETYQEAADTMQRASEAAFDAVVAYYYGPNPASYDAGPLIQGVLVTILIKMVEGGNSDDACRTELCKLANDLLPQIRPQVEARTAVMQ